MTERICPHKADRTSRIRRAVYSYVTTFICLGATISFVYLGYESTLAAKVAEALMSFAELMAMLYLGASVIDKTRVVDRINDTLNPPKKESNDVPPQSP